MKKINEKIINSKIEFSNSLVNDLNLALQLLIILNLFNYSKTFLISQTIKCRLYFWHYKQNQTPVTTTFTPRGLSSL